MKAIRFVVVSLSVFFGFLYVLYISYVYCNQAEMVFHASKLPADYKFEFEQKFEEITITSYDNVHLNGLLFKANKSKGLIFYLHGNAGSLDSWGNNAKIYTDLGYDIFFLDYRGFGKSEGEIENQEQIYNDISLVYDKVTSNYNKANVVIIGYSIGTGLATYLASIKQPQKLILQAPFYNFTEFSSGRVPFYPDFLKKFDFKTNEYIVKVTSPIYIFHGNKDQVISYDNSVRLQKLLQPKDAFYTLEDEDHIGINDNSDFQEKLQLILK